MTSPEPRPIVGRLADALAAMSNPVPTASSHHGRYVPLDALLDHVRPVLAASGLAVTQHVTEAGVETVIVSVDGERLELGCYPVAWGSSSQANGSAVTYARRYGLAAALGLFGDADDDGAASSSRQAAHVARGGTKPGRAAPEPTLTDSQLKRLQIEWKHVDRAERLEAWAALIGRSVSTAKELTKAEAGVLIDAAPRKDEG